MTAEEAIEILSDVGDINRCCAEDAEALDMAIKALEQQQKTGRWIDIDCQSYTWQIKCPFCNHIRSMMSTQGIYPNYCENCGRKMEA